MPGISDSPPSRPKRLVPTNFSAEILLQPLRLDHALHDHAAAFEGEVGAVLDVLDALLDPRLLVGIGDVHVLDADLAAVGLAQPVHDLAQGRGIAEAERAEDQDRAVPVGLAEAVGRGIELAMRRLAHQAQRIEVGLEMAADAVGADQQEGARRCRRRRRGSRLRRAGRRSGMARRPCRLDVAVGGRRAASRCRGTSMTRAPLGAQEAPRTSASTSPCSSASASKKVRQSASTRVRVARGSARRAPR